MRYVAKLLELDRRLKTRLPMAPIRTAPPTKAEDDLRRILHAPGVQHAAKLASAVGISRC